MAAMMEKYGAQIEEIFNKIVKFLDELLDKYVKELEGMIDVD